MGDDLKNTVRFSASREATLDECERKFYYAVYLAHGGWWSRDRRPEPRRAEAYQLCHLTTEVDLVGTLVHSFAEWALNQARRDGDFLRRWGGREGIRDYMVNTADIKITEMLAQARSDVYGNPKEWTQLLSIKLGKQTNETWLRARVRSRLEALMAPDALWNNGNKPRINLLMRALAHHEGIVHVDELIRWTTPISGFPVESFLKHDLVMRNDRDPSACVIIDWMIGCVKDDEEDPLDFYAAWAINNGWKRVDIALVTPSEGVTEVLWMTPDLAESANRAKFRMMSFIDKLRERLVDGDLEKNEPIEDRFVPTTDKIKCRRCQFQLLCERDGTKPK